MKMRTISFMPNQHLSGSERSRVPVPSARWRSMLRGRVWRVSIFIACVTVGCTAIVMAGQAAVAGAADQFSWPANGTISQNVNGHLATESLKAVDITAGAGTPIYASASGTIVFAGD